MSSAARTAFVPQPDDPRLLFQTGQRLRNLFLTPAKAERASEANALRPPPDIHTRSGQPVRQAGPSRCPQTNRPSPRPTGPPGELDELPAFRRK